MYRSRRAAFLSTSAGLALLFGLITYSSSPLVASVVLASGLAGYFNVFVVIPALVSLTQRQSISWPTAAWAIASATVSAVLCYTGYWVVLALCTAAFLVIYAAVVLSVRR